MPAPSAVRRPVWLAFTAAALLFSVSCSNSSSTPTEPDQPLAVAISGNGTVTSTPAGISCIASGGLPSGSCAATYDAGSSVTLTANAGQGSTFQGWAGACSGTGSCALTMSSGRSVTASFAATAFVLTTTSAGNGTGTITSNPAGIVCDVTGGQATGQCSAPFPAGTAVTLRLTPVAGSTLAGWTGACTGTSTCNVTMDAAKSAAATIALLSYPVTVSGLGSGSGSVTSAPAGITCTIQNGVTSGTCTASFASGTNVTLTGVPGGTSDFAGWNGFCAGTGSCALEVTGNRNVTASFTLKQFALTVTGLGTGNGTITSAPAGISCTSTSGMVTGTCSASFAAGTSVTLTGSAASGSAFGGWGGGCSGTGSCQVTMDAAKAASATFNTVVITFPVTVTGAGSGSGTVTSNPAGIACTITNGVASGTCAFSFAQGTVATLTAAATGGSNFGGWSGACSGAGTCALTVDGAKSVTATFGVPVVTQTLVVSGGGTGSGTVTSSPAGISCNVSGGSANGTCSFAFVQGTSVTLSAAPGAGDSFSGWSGACSGTGTCPVTMDALKNVTATFTAPPPAFAITPDFAIVAPGANITLGANAAPVVAVSRATGVATVSGLTVTGVAAGWTDIVGTNAGSTDSSRIGVVATNGFGLIASQAQNTAFHSVAAGGTIALDVWLIRPAGASTDSIASITGSFTWDPTKFQYVSFSATIGALTDGWGITPNTANVSTGVLQYSAFSATGTTITFSLARLTLRAIGAASATFFPLTPTVSVAGTSLGATITSRVVPIPSAIRIQ